MPRPSPLFPASAVERLDAFRARLRIDTCRVQSKTITVDRGGAQVETWGALGAPVPCAVTPASGAIAEGIRGGRIVPEADVAIRLHRDVGVRRDDRVHHTESGHVYDVLNDPGIATIGLEIVISGKDSDG